MRCGLGELQGKPVINVRDGCRLGAVADLEFDTDTARVAALLGTRAVIGKDAPVANALGAIASQVVTRVRLRVKVEYRGAEFLGFSVYEGTERKLFRDYHQALELAEKLARAQVLEKIRRRGGFENPAVQVEFREIGGKGSNLPMLFETIVEATAVSAFRL